MTRRNWFLAILASLLGRRTPKSKALVFHRDAFTLVWPARFTSAALMLFALVASAQTVPDAFCTYKATVNPSSEAITVQKPTTSNRVIRPQFFWCHSTAANTCTFEVRGTAATTTALAIAALTGASATATSYSASNVGAGTVVAVYEVPAGGQGVTVDLSRVALAGSPATENLTVKPGNITGTVKVLICWEEQR